MYPELEILHIAGCTAAQIKRRGLVTVGLVGTKVTMQKKYLRERLESHGLNVIVPDSEEVQSAIFGIIKYELSLGIFRDSSREYIVEALDALGRRGAQGVILGCTEIELLVRDYVALPVFPSAELHIRGIVEMLVLAAATKK